jgi:phosphatidylserine/phosphatidylglycerophosphate/cardiolipin synthase-like enzyme
VSLSGLHRLTTASLRALGAELRRHDSVHLTKRALQQIAGPQADAVEAALGSLAHTMTGAQAALVVDAIADTRAETPAVADIVDLVLSGPDVADFPTRDTAAVICEIIEAAGTEVLVAGYAIHNARRVFERLAHRMQERPDLRVTLVVDIGRPWSDTSLDSQVVARFAHEFRTKHWPWHPMPPIYYDPRSLSMANDKRSAMHAKCVVVDRQIAFITSANLTEAAQERNIEVGVAVRDAPLAARLVGWFEGLIVARVLARCSV